MAALALLVIQGIAHTAIPGRQVAPPPAGGFGWILAANLLVALVLTYLAARLELTGGRPVLQCMASSSLDCLALKPGPSNTRRRSP